MPAIPTVKFITELDVKKLKIRKLARDLGPRRAARVLLTSVEAVLTPAVRKRIKDNKTVDLGNLFRNINTKVAHINDPSVGAVDFGTFGIRYGLAIELGGRPHIPPFKPIFQWVKRRVHPKDPYPYALAVIETIRTKGTRPYPYIIPSIERNKRKLVTDYVLRMKAALGT